MSGDSSGRILGTIVGAVAGYFTGGASYVALGASLGGAVGSLLDPKAQIEGPRLDDLKVQFSTYGVGIPILYGTQRVGGNVIWSTDKIEQSTTTSTGKGGGTENTSYRYYVQMRIMLCETPRDGSTVNIIQIFQDGKLIYDARTGIPVESALASVENPYAFFTLYQGGPDQLPDPVEELYESGPGSVPAYRGVVSISMKGIECPGGRIPQFSFVLSNSATVGSADHVISPRPYEDEAEWYSGSVTANGSYDVAEFGGFSGEPRIVRISRVETTGAFLIHNRTVAFDPNFDLGFVTLHGLSAPSCIRAVYVGSPERSLEVLDLATGEISTLGTVTTSEPLSHAYYDEISGKYAFVFERTDKSQPLDVVIYDTEEAPLVITLPADSAENVVLYSGVMSTLSNHDGSSWLRKYSATTGDFLSEVGYPGLLSLTTGPFSNVVLSEQPMYATTEGVYILLSNEERVYLVDTAWTQLATLSAGSQFSEFAGFWADSTHAYIGAWPVGYVFVQYRTASTDAYPVADIIADQCERAGEYRFDTSGIDSEETVIGYVIASPASARANIDPLLTHSLLFIVDEDESIRFKQFADIVSVATIAYEELGQGEDSTGPGDPMPLNRKQEIDLPRSVTCSYIEPLHDYQTASEKEIRLVTDATEDQTLNLPIATTSDKARRAAQAVLFNQWRSQNTRSLSVARKYAFLSPGDGVTVEYPEGTFRLWRILSTNDTGVVVELTVEPGDAELYTQTAVGATGYVGQQVAPVAPPTTFQIVDGPILRDQDDNAGPYVAMTGLGAGWSGAELFVGDDVPSMLSRGTVASSAVQGITENALGDWDLNIVDETNVLTVDVGSGTLSSITREAMLTGTQNVAAVGANGRVEIIKFQRATSLGGGLYMLTGLMRGLRGTEHATGSHQMGDFFVVMGLAGTLRPETAVGEIGMAKAYRAVSKGRAFESGVTKSYANTGEGLRPFSPTNLRKDFDGDDIVLDWVRRTRLSENWLLGIVPLGEASELWEVVIYEDDTFSSPVRTITTTTASATYTSAMQMADFGSLQTEVSVRIYQISDAVGRGHELEETL